MGHSWTWPSGEHSGAGLSVELSHLRGLFQPKQLPDSLRGYLHFEEILKCRAVHQQNYIQ